MDKNQPKKRIQSPIDSKQTDNPENRPKQIPKPDKSKRNPSAQDNKPLAHRRHSPTQISKQTPQKLSQRPKLSPPSKKLLKPPESMKTARSKALQKTGHQKITPSDKAVHIGPSEFRAPRRAGMGLFSRFMFSISGMLIGILIFFFVVIMFIATKTINEEIKKGGAMAAESLSALSQNYIETVYNEKFFEALLKDKKTEKLLISKFEPIRTSFDQDFDRFLIDLERPIPQFEIDTRLVGYFKNIRIHKKAPEYDNFSEIKTDTALALIYINKLHNNPIVNFKITPNAHLQKEVIKGYDDNDLVASFYLFTMYPDYPREMTQQYRKFLQDINSVKENYDRYVSIFRQSIQKQYHYDFSDNFITPIKERDSRINGVYFARQLGPQVIDTFVTEGFKPVSITNFPDSYGKVKISNPESGAIQFYFDFTANFSNPEIGKREDVKYTGIIEYDNSKLKKPRNWLMISLIVLALLAMIIGISVSYFLAHNVTKPIMQLVDNVQQIAQGNYKVRTQLKRRDELWVLGKTLDMMCDNLESAKELAAVYKKVKHDIDITEEVVIQLLPDSIPKLTGYDVSAYYHPAREVGGDYYDFIEIDDNHIGMIVADVSGKGIPGAMVMTMARTIIRFEAANNLSGKEVFIRANAHISRDIKRGMFVTAFYIILNKLKAEIASVSAGHNPMMIWRRATGKVDKINPNGIALGFDKGQIFERTIKEEVTQLYSGDRVVLYTDGVIEAMSPDSEEFGETKLEQLLADNPDVASSQFTSLIEQALIEHQGGISDELQHDDITVVTFKVL